VRVAISPVQSKVLPETVIEGEAFTVTVANAVSEQEPLETTTVKVEVEVKVKEMEDVVTPVLHE